MNLIENPVPFKVSRVCGILPQNGVSSPLGSSIDSLNGNVSVPSKRPTNLVITSEKEYDAKNHRNESGNNDGSLPSSPESYSEGSACPAGDEVLASDTRQLVSLFLRDGTGPSNANLKKNKPLSTMKRVVEDVLVKYRITYNGKSPPA